MYNKNCIDKKNKEIVNDENYEDKNKKKLNFCYLDIFECNKNNAENKEKKHKKHFESVQNIIDKSLSHDISNEIEINAEKIKKRGDEEVCSNEEKNIVNKSEVGGKDDDKEMSKGKENIRKDSPMPDKNQKEIVEKTRK